MIAAIQEAIALKAPTTSGSSTCRWAAELARAIRRILSARQLKPHGRAEFWWLSPPAIMAALSVFGSNGYGTITAPGNDPLVLTVGATKSQRIDFRRCRNLSQLQFEGPNDV